MTARTVGSLCADDLGATVTLPSGWVGELQIVLHKAGRTSIEVAGLAHGYDDPDIPCEVTR